MLDTIRLRRVLSGSAIFLSLSLGAPAGPAAAQTAELRCRQAIEASLAKWTIETLKLRQRCVSDIVSGFQEATTDCIHGDGEPALQRSLADARARLEGRLAAACADANWGLLSYPGPCPETTPFTASSLAHCIETVGTESQAELFSTWYPSSFGVLRGSSGECVRTTGKRASSMVVREMRTRLRCLLEAEAAGDQQSVDCRAQMVPYGSGTGVADVDTSVLRAQRPWTSGIPAACSAAPFEELGFGAGCDDSGGDGVGIVDFHACVFRANRLEVPVLLDLAFPSDPVCGNGILQEGEVCDEGAGNSDTTPDACRSDCTLPVCGDGTADPGNDEDCDDGNFVDLDGCTASCGLEFCGDGLVNDLPNETCDDGNTNPNDLCTGTCRVAACGDGVVCSDPACTSGPDDGPEMCDFGAGNVDGGQCDTTCFGYARSCTLTIGVANSLRIGALTYELGYKNADGEVEGSAGAVKCRSLVTGGLVSFFDNEAKRTVKESLIVDAGLQAPASIAECDYVSNDSGLAPGDFSFAVQAASDPDLEPINVNLAVTAIDCEP